MATRKSWTSEMFKNKVDHIFKGRIEVIGRYSTMKEKVLVKDKHGLLFVSPDKLLQGKVPSIMSAVNKTQYFMSMFKSSGNSAYYELTAIGEYKTMKSGMLFQHDFGIVRMTPDNLLQGKGPDSRSAIDRAAWYREQLNCLYGDKYTYSINTANRKSKVECTCDIHGVFETSIGDLLEGYECKDCTPSNTVYLIKLSLDDETFYKVGVSYINAKGVISRYSSYKSLGYSISEIGLRICTSTSAAYSTENNIKRMIKDYRTSPKVWKSKSSTEAFVGDLVAEHIRKMFFD